MLLALGIPDPYNGQDKIRRFCCIDTTDIQVAARVAQQAREVLLHDGSFLKIMVVSVPSTSFNTLTFPGKELKKWKCCIFDPF